MKFPGLTDEYPILNTHIETIYVLATVFLQYYEPQQDDFCAGGAAWSSTICRFLEFPPLVSVFTRCWSFAIALVSILRVSSRNSSSTPLFCLADVWKWKAPTSWAYLCEERITFVNYIKHKILNNTNLLFDNQKYEYLKNLRLGSQPLNQISEPVPNRYHGIYDSINTFMKQHWKLLATEGCSQLKRFMLASGRKFISCDPNFHKYYVMVAS